eukprot:CAMPEP_0114439404 /NCGR_PEP_ID=MMETSP0103-20121206/15178_1 /TAXON_ID=37642 ORGANISM="Paraphysomonas imperforata, Strain PA2" /NCGR_SAMPLE_ID=MMETSP0103 /ASSEMBLY_ACC=CAM_ASM_000201 /LENGTH=441 /DNA_ID=CAMNT_0001610159 /DNA_START=59 /DNA_END=1381 /DNA_ORIENTATION=-
MANVADLDYYDHLMLVMALLKSYYDSYEGFGVPYVLIVFRFLTLISLIAYNYILYRVKKYDEKSIFKLQTSGNVLLLLNAVVAGIWIRHTMRHYSCSDLPANAVTSCLISLCLNMIYSVHSSWAAVIVVLAEIVCLFSGIDGNLPQLEEKNLEMRSLIGNVAHDLKTPLQAIVSELDCISDDDSGTRDSLRGISDFMAMMINRSIDFTKVQSGRNLQPSMESVNIANCVDWVVNTISQSRKESEVTVTTEYDLQGAAEWVITDKHWLLENLLCYMSNAVKFVSDGSITIKVSADFNDSENNQHFNNGQHDIENVSLQPASTASIIDKVRTKFSSPIAPEASSSESEVKYFQNGLKSKAHENVIIFSVIDTGVGISQDKMDGLFQPFFQAQKGAGGTGLGLYALSKRVEALGGEYGVRGRDDGAQGSCFWFSIPYRPDTELT